MTVSGIGHVGLVVGDLERAIAFYTDVLGLRLTERFEYPDAGTGHGTAVRGAAFLRAGADHHTVALFVLRDPAPAAAPGALHHLAFALPTPAQLLALYRRFHDLGLPVVEARRGGPGNQPRFYARDPDGNLLEFYWGMDQIGWDGAPRGYDPIQAIDLEAFDFAAYLARREADAEAAGKAPTDERGPVSLSSLPGISDRQPSRDC